MAPHLKKLEDRGVKMIFVGYERGSKAFRAYDQRTGRVHVTRDVIFNEGGQWDWSGDVAHDDTASGDANNFTIQYMASLAPSALEWEDTASPAASAPSSITPVAGSRPSSSATSTAMAGATLGTSPGSEDMTMPGTGIAPAVQFASPPAVLGEGELDADHDDDLPPCFRTLENIVGPAAMPGLTVRNLGRGPLLAVSAEEPASLAQAKKEACWRRAMEEELQAIEENRTWTLTDLPPGRQAIGLKWVYKVKKDERGAVVRHKAQLSSSLRHAWKPCSCWWLWLPVKAGRSITWT